MTKRRTSIIITAALVAVLLGAAFLYRSLSEKADAGSPQAQSTAEREAEKTAAPDFEMLDWSGDSVLLSEYVGTPIVLNFWASWCGPCKSEMPVFDSVAAELAGKVQFLMVNLTDGGRETTESAARFISEHGYDFPVFFDTLSEGAAAYSVRSIPVTYFIDGEGNALAYFAGRMNEKTLRQGIDMIIGE